MKDRLNILFIGKYPPYVGGETTKIYWLLRALAERGHKIYVVSNGWELPLEWSCKITLDDLDYLQFKNLKLFSTSFHSTPFFIPPYNPMTEKLASLGIEVIENYDVDIIFSWYLIPFCSVAFILSKITGIPYVISNAGSDIHRLFRSIYYQDYLIEIIKNAQGVITYRSSERIMRNLNKNVMIHGFPVDPDWYVTKPIKYSKNRRLIELVQLYSYDKYVDKNTMILEKTINDNKKILVVPSKWEKSKGIYQWVTLAKKLSDTVTLLLIGNGFIRNEILKEIRDLDNVIWLPFIPTWRMPEIYSCVDLVGHLEINFPVPHHHSLVVIEAQLSGKPILTNLEIKFILNSKNLNVFKITLDEYNHININDELIRFISESKVDIIFKDENLELLRNYWISRVKNVENFLWKCNDKESK